MSPETRRLTQSSPVRVLFAVFVAWKALLWTVVYLSPGIGYDTSSDLLQYTSHNGSYQDDVPLDISHSLLKFVRWDAIYYTHLSHHGHVFEQEWAFGKGLSTVLKFMVQGTVGKANGSILDHTFAGVLVSHISHLLSVILIFNIAKTVQDRNGARVSSIPLTAALLHIISPAGVFLSAPYSESLFSFLNMLGFYLYVKSTHSSTYDVDANKLVLLLCSGVAFGFATTVRGNGILSGIPFFLDAIETALQVVSPHTDTFVKSRLLLKLQFIVISGSCVAIGTVYPQYLAYREYCIEGPGDRPWCQLWLPSIFAFVQSHYWNVGFLKYWTVSNVPLFLLASPCLYLLITSGTYGVRPALSQQPTLMEKLYLRLALPQLVLAILAITNYHVQIITRLSSGYPYWYLWTAANLANWKYSKSMIRTLILYGMIQAGLFASFLPPA